MNRDQLERELAKFNKPTPAQDRRLYLRMLLYGTWGVGKSILASQIGLNPLMLITEPSDDSLADWPDISARVDVVQYGGVNHLGLIRDAFREGLYPNDTLIIDTASELIEEQLDAVKDGWSSPKSTRPTFTAKTAGGKSMEINGTDDYHLIRNILRPVIKDLCLLPINLIFIAHERSTTWADEQKLKTDGTPLPPTRPDLPSQTLTMIAKRVSVVGRMTKDGDKRQLSFASDRRSREEVKSRIRALDNRRLSDTEFLSIVNEWRNTHD